MADPTDIPAPLSDRSLAHGRNVMVAASVILVLAWVSHIEIDKFEPLGFKIDEDGVLSVWGILTIVLVYCAVRFFADFATDFRGWIDAYGGYTKTPRGAATRSRSYDRHVRRLKSKCLWFDVAPPVLMFLVALVAAGQRIIPLAWPPLP